MRWKNALVLASMLLTPMVLTAQPIAPIPGANTEEQKPPLTRILFVFDASYSMYGRWENATKMESAQRMMSRLLDSLASLPNPNFELALRAYGHQKPVPPQDCEDTKLEVPFAKDNMSRIKKRIQSLKPMGTTPIARSLLRSGGDFPPCSDCRNIVVLITDGIEACDEDPCAVSAMLQKKGIVLRPFIIGVGLDAEQKKLFDCVGTYIDATNESSFKQALGIVMTQVLNNTTAQINLLDAQDIPSETDISLLLEDQLTGKTVQSFVHTLNYKGNPDTLLLDPLITYTLKIGTVPPVTVDSLRIVPGKHNHIGAKTPTGFLEITVPGLTATSPLAPVVVRQLGSEAILHVQTVNAKQRYLIGTYKVEILTLPRYEEIVTISPNKTTQLAVPAPGDATIQLKAPSIGSIYVEKSGHWSWLLDLDTHLLRQQYRLQPGTYKMVVRPRAAQQTLYSRTVGFTIGSGISTLVKTP